MNVAVGATGGGPADRAYLDWDDARATRA